MTTIEQRIQEIEEKFRQLGYRIEPSLSSLDEELDAIFSLETNELVADSEMTDELATLATEWAQAVREKSSGPQEAPRDAHEAPSGERWKATDQVQFGRDNQISVQAFAGLYRYSGLGTGKYFSRDGCAYWIDPVQASQMADAEGSHYVYWDCEQSAPTVTLTSKYVNNYMASLEASIKMIASEARIAASGERRFGDPPGTDRVKNIMALCASALAKMDMKSRCEHLVMGEKAKNREEAKLMVHHLAEKHGIVLSDWKPSAAIEWEYCDGHIGGSSDVTLRIGASTGGTVQLNGDPYTPDRRFANDCIESLSVSLQPHLMRMSLRQEIKRVVVEEPGNSFSASRLFVQMREAGFSPDWRNRQDEQGTHYAITLPSSEVDAYRNGIGRQLAGGNPGVTKQAPDLEPAPYDPNDMDAAVAYSKRIKTLFDNSDHDGAYALYMKDPNGGALACFSDMTKARFVQSIYSERCVQGSALRSQPEGYQYAGFAVGHQGHLRDGDHWGRISHIYSFDEKTYIELDFGKPMSSFMDGDGRRQVQVHLPGASLHDGARVSTKLMVAASEIDQTQPMAPCAEDSSLEP